jgi:ornithine cyclodeaminase
LEAIKRILPRVDLLGLLEQGFIAYSRGEVVVPPPGELLFHQPPGDMHIKFGYIKGDEEYVVKIASGFYENQALGLPSSLGLMLLFCSRTGILKAILLDEGHLTNVRTAAAGAVVARHLAPPEPDCIGIVGAGTQGKLQLLHLFSVVSVEKVLVCTPDEAEIAGYRAFFEATEKQLDLRFTQDPEEIARNCNLIVTTTPSNKPLLTSSAIQPGTHITAVGSDTPEKIELDPSVLAEADLVVVDSLAQSRNRGEVFQAVRAEAIDRDKPRELGNVIVNKRLGRQSEHQITIADLTGVAVQDIQIAKAVYQGLDNQDRVVK